MNDKALGCIFGLAVGDALGAPVEFMSRNEILAKHGPSGVTELHPWDEFASGSWTDDTQMSLATARGLIRAREAGQLASPATFIHEEYLAWLVGEHLKVRVFMQCRTGNGKCGFASSADNLDKIKALRQAGLASDSRRVQFDPYQVGSGLPVLATSRVLYVCVV